MSSCTDLAAKLSTSFLSSALYDGVTPLAEYLAMTGVLLSMCLGGNCTADPIPHPKDNVHLSGSWIQQSTTGARIFAPFHGAAGHGMAINPQEVEIQCVYPLDALTDKRQDQGCGKVDFDISWRQKAYIKLNVYYRKYTRFPWKKWEDIPCSGLWNSTKDGDLFDLQGRPPGPFWSMKQAGMIDRDQTWKSMLYITAEIVKGIIGHTVCYDDVDPDFDDGFMLPYFGDESWLPEEWNESANVTKAVIDQHPTSRGIWNEVVISHVPEEDYATAMEAMFYVLQPDNPDEEEENRRMAYSEAKRLGIEHVLEFDPKAADTSLFRCPSDLFHLDTLSVEFN